MFKIVLLIASMIMPQPQFETLQSPKYIPEFDGYIRDIAIIEEEEPDRTHRFDEVCSVTRDFKSYMDYRAITNTSSKQWKLQQDAYTENGYRKYNGRIMVAMAMYPVGQELDVYLDTGEILEVVIGDVKANTSCAHPDQSIIEFIVDTKTMDSYVKAMGSYHVIHEGFIIKIKVYT